MAQIPHDAELRLPGTNKTVELTHPPCDVNHQRKGQLCRRLNDRLWSVRHAYPALTTRLQINIIEPCTEISDELWEIYYAEGVDKLLEMLKKFDGESAERLSAERNPKRIIRAIEFYKTTGITITEQNKKSKNEESPYSPVKLGINFEDRQKLYDRINQRVDLMLEEGLVAEAKRVYNSELSFTSVKAIGYKELFPYLKGELPLEECIEKLETRRYAKRQITWFKRDKEINWLYPDKAESFEELFKQAVQITDKGLTYGQTAI